MMWGWFTPTIYADGNTSLPTVNNAFLQVSGSDLTLYNQPFVMKGFNYLPRKERYQPMVEWNWVEVEKDLQRAASLGANTVRTFVDFYENDNTGTQLAAARTFLKLADQNGLRVIFSIFENMPGYDIIDAKHYERGYVYLQQFVAPLRNDPRIAAWDVLNEGDYLPIRFSQYTTMELVLQFYHVMSAKIREIDPNHLLTAGFAFVEQVSVTQDFVDFISFHSYGDAYRLPAKVDGLVASLNRPMPIVVTETGAPSSGNQWSSERNQSIVLADQLETIFADNRLDGALIWQLNDYVPRELETSQTEPFYGVFNLQLAPKPAVQQVRRYFNANCSRESRLKLRMSNGLEEPLPDDARFLSGAYSKIRMLGRHGAVLQEWKFGSSASDQALGKGWYPSESWGRWGKREVTFHLHSGFFNVTGNTFLEVSVQSYMKDAQLEAWLDGVYLGNVKVTQVGEPMGTAPRFTLKKNVLVSPNPPRGLAVARVLPESVDMVWSAAASSTAPHCYEMFRDGIKVGTIADGTLLRVTKLRDKTFYKMTLRAVNRQGGNSGYTQPVTVSMSKKMPLSAPRGLTIKKVSMSNGAIRWLVYWEDPGLREDGQTAAAEFQVTISSDNQFANGSKTVTFKSIAPYFYLADRGTPLYVRVSAISRTLEVSRVSQTGIAMLNFFCQPLSMSAFL
jgi:hypothetical protein